MSGGGKGGEQSPPFPFRPFPNGTPPIVQRTILDLLRAPEWSDGKPARQILEKLAFDPRMESVWHELTRRGLDDQLVNKPTGEYPFPAVLQAAIIHWSIAENLIPWLPTKQHAINVARDMRRDARIYQTLSCSLGDDANLKAIKLDRQGRSLQQQLKKVPLPTRPGTIPSEIKGTINALITTNLSLYGKVLEGTTATLVLVIHNHQVSASMIQKQAKTLSI